MLFQIFSLYEINDIKVSDKNFLNFKSYLKFCNDFHLIPSLCSSNQASKIFKIFEEKNQGFILYSSFIMALCSIAHIGMSQK